MGSLSVDKKNQGHLQYSKTVEVENRKHEDKCRIDSR